MTIQPPSTSYTPTLPYSSVLSTAHAHAHVHPPMQRSGAQHSSPQWVGPTICSPNEAEGKRLSRASKDVLFGSAAGMVAKVFEHPFDLIKVRLQTQPFSDPAPGQGRPKGTLYAGPIDAFRSTIRKEGIVGLFRGLSMPIFGATLENASLFFTYNAIQGQIRRLGGQGTPSSSSIELDSEAPLSLPQLAIAAAGAGAVTSFVLTPVELIKCRMQVQMVSAEATILAQEAARAAAAAAATTASATTSTAATAVPPASSTSASSMTQALNAARRNLPGPVALFTQTVREGGLRSLWLGQTGTLLRETGGGVAWFLVFESTCRWFVKRRQEEHRHSGSGSGSTKITKDDLASWQLMLAGAMAGVSYNVVLFPADSVKSTMQTQRELASSSSSGSGSSGGKPPPTLGFVGTLKSIYRTRGLGGLYAGCGITCLRSGPSSALIFLLYNRLEGWADRAGL